MEQVQEAEGNWCWSCRGSSADSLQSGVRCATATTAADQFNPAVGHQDHQCHNIWGHWSSDMRSLNTATKVL